MEQQPYTAIEEMELFRRYVHTGDWVWEQVGRWEPFARDTMGKQLVRAIDSVGANLVEGDGRYSDAEAVHFFIIARASARETRFWLQRAVTRKLITPEQGEHQMTVLASATRQLNQLIRYRRSKSVKKSRVAETAVSYRVSTPQLRSDGEADDPFIER